MNSLEYAAAIKLAAVRREEILRILTKRGPKGASKGELRDLLQVSESNIHDYTRSLRTQGKAGTTSGHRAVRTWVLTKHIDEGRKLAEARWRASREVDRVVRMKRQVARRAAKRGAKTAPGVDIDDAPIVRMVVQQWTPAPAPHVPRSIFDMARFL